MSHRSDARPCRNHATSIFVPLLAALLVFGGIVSAHAEPNSDERNWNMPLKTFGGMQLWADSYLHAGWRIQRNVVTGHSRLLDAENIRRAWGSFEHCKRIFDESRHRDGIVPASSHLVLLVHGIAPKPGTFSAMERVLDDAGFDATPISYPSTRGPIEVHAAGLEKLLNRVEGTTRVSFVTHSMGGLVVRHLLHRNGAWKKRIEVGRIIHIAPPHRGSAMAEGLSDLKPYEWILGDAGQQLTPRRASTVPPLELPFAIIAGGKGNDEGFNPFLPGDDDGVVAVDETRLHGARDFLIVKATHITLTRNPETIRATLAFLKGGTLAKQAEAK
ncbi:MAG: hypothetical protein MPJ78_01780 [Hyphomicrobiaceae bacterium]|nr:hypothetical protein [Hyphomicrobiaceae bacterium]